MNRDHHQKNPQCPPCMLLSYLNRCLIFRSALSTSNFFDMIFNGIYDTIAWLSTCKVICTVIRFWYLKQSRTSRELTPFGRVLENLVTGHVLKFTSFYTNCVFRNPSLKDYYRVTKNPPLIPILLQMNSPLILIVIQMTLPLIVIVIQINPSLILILTQMNLVHTFPFGAFRVNFNVILSIAPRFPRCLRESVLTPCSSVISVTLSSRHSQFPWLFCAPLWLQCISAFN